ncbi:amidohydrolase [Maricaulis sp. W15]|uniref:amidohydrolase n=1 Tax=Maricaulis sp. W15 TaxID=1772333 RepID=UPI000948A893|nr:amidohydrolase [Maricaulis sp. W15]OLF71899.1 amidohydrolase [Maricaulis sp. W15]
MRANNWMISLAVLALAGCDGGADMAPLADGTDGALSESAADLVIWGGPIYTARDDQPMVEAVAVRGNRIAFVGDDEAAQAWIGEGTRLIDLNGGALYPGFTDSHIHVYGVGQRERTLNLDDVTSVAQLVSRVEAAIADTPAGETLAGRGWIETHWPEGRFPTRQDLDPVSPDNPVILRRADGHALIANSAALAAVGITRDSVAPSGGEILFDADGEPTGLLVDTAMGAVSPLMETPSPDVIRDTYADGARRLVSLGWAGAHDMSVPWSMVPVIEGLAEAGDLPLRTYLSVGPEGYAPLAAGGHRDVADGRVITRAVKLYMDGALGSRGAALLEPYADRPETSGLAIAEADETIGLFIDALRQGIQMNVHAIGDRGNRYLLDWVEEARAQVPPEEWALADPRWRDEHSQIIDPADIPRFAELGVIASFQPSHAIGDLHFAPDRLGDDRLDGAYAWQSLLDAGAHITGGSDAPVEQGDPRIEFYAAVARADLSGFQGENWHAEEALSREDALKLFTAWPAYASFREDELGTIAVGMIADFTVFSEDIMTIPEAEILTVEPWMTVVDGEVVYESPDSFHHGE